VVLPDAGYDHDQRQAVSMDGGMVNIGEEGWRELKVGAVFDLALRRERNPRTQALDEMAQAENIHYPAVLGSKETFPPALGALAVEHQLPTARERAVVADSVLWIGNVAEDICPDGRQIVDGSPACHHLAEAAQARYPDDEKSRQRWFNLLKDWLYLGQIQTIIHSLS